MKDRLEALVFSKQPPFPSSETLLNAVAPPPALTLQSTESQLACCDFCSAELQLLARHPPRSDESHVRANVPLWVRLFAARAVLKNAGVIRPRRTRTA
jgi:hypothetical protein